MSKAFSHIELLKSMLAIPARSREEDRRSNFLQEVLEDLGHPVLRVHNNLLVGDPLDGDKGINILLNSHMDTVKAAEGWQSDPDLPLVEDGKITALGSNDAGASLICLLAAYHEMAPRLKGRINLSLLISAEEEISGPRGMEAMVPRLGSPYGVIVGEPTGMQPAVAERGLMVLDGTAGGKAGHAARAEGINAIYRAMEDVKRIEALDFPEASRWLPPAGAQVTMIEAGTGHNVVPDVCRFVVDVRSNDCYDNERMLAMITRECQSELIPRSTRLKPSILDQDHLFMQAIGTCGLEAFGSSTLSDMALLPFPSLKMGPGQSARSHSAGEFILESELEEGLQAYCRFLEALGELAEKKKTDSQ